MIQKLLITSTQGVEREYVVGKPPKGSNLIVETIEASSSQCNENGDIAIPGRFVIRGKGGFVIATVSQLCPTITEHY